MNDSLSEVEISQEWIATPCFKTALKILNDFIRAVPNSRGKVNPVVRQLSIPWKDTAPSTQRYYKQKGMEVVQLALDCLAPGQATTLLAELISKEDAKVQNKRKESVESSELSRLVTLYEEANSWFTKRQILSVFVNDYTKARLQQIIPGLSIWAIDEARRHAAKTGLGKPIPQRDTFTHTASPQQGRSLPRLH